MVVVVLVAVILNKFYKPARASILVIYLCQVKHGHSKNTISQYQISKEIM